MSKKIKGVIFDFNGTLFLDNDKHVLAWGEISKIIRGRGITQSELLNYCNGVPNQKVVSYLFNKEVELSELERYSELKEEFYRSFCLQDKDNFHLISGAKEFFNYLQENGIPFTIASASIKANIDFFVKEFELEKWIKSENIVYDNGSYENKIDMFLDAAKMLNVDIKDCIIFEDSVSGIKSGYSAGCRNIIVMDSSNKAEEYRVLPGVIKVINNFSIDPQELLM